MDRPGAAQYVARKGLGFPRTEQVAEDCIPPRRPCSIPPKTESPSAIVSGSRPRARLRVHSLAGEDQHSPAQPTKGEAISETAGPT